MEHHPVLQVTALFAVLEQHQCRDAEHGHDVLQDHVHRQAEHLPVKKPSENVRDDRQGENREQVFGFQAEKRDSRPEIAVRRFTSSDIAPFPFLR